MQSLQQIIISLSVFINDVVIPFLFALALLFFIYNTAKYFILSGDKEREKAKDFALYGILAFVVLVSIWGIVNLLLRGLGWGYDNPIAPDYFWTQGVSQSYYGSPTTGGELGPGPTGNSSGWWGSSNNTQNVRENNFWNTTGAP